MDFLFTQEQHHFFGFETSPPTEESLRSFVNYHQLQPTNIRLEQDAPSVSVFLPCSMNNSWTTTSNCPSERGKNVAQKNELQARRVFTLQMKWNSLLKAVFSSVKAFHLSAFPSALSKYSFGKARKNMFIHLRKEQFDLSFPRRSIVGANSFPQKMPTNSCIICSMCEQFYLKP